MLDAETLIANCHEKRAPSTHKSERASSRNRRKIGPPRGLCSLSGPAHFDPSSSRTLLPFFSFPPFVRSLPLYGSVAPPAFPLQLLQTNDLKIAPPIKRSRNCTPDTFSAAAENKRPPQSEFQLVTTCAALFSACLGLLDPLLGRAHPHRRRRGFHFGP